MHGVTTIDAGYGGHEGFAAVFLICDGEEAAFVETNTTKSVPRLLAALEAAGRRPEDVRWIIITHVHLDHAGGASALMKACPEATLLAHPKAAEHVVAPEKLVRSSIAVYGEEAFRALYGTIEPVEAARVRAVAPDETVALGERRLRFFPTRGHANHHICIHDSRANGVFTGDSFGICYPHLQANGLVVFPTTTPTDFDAAEALKSLDAIVGTGAERVFMTHFGEREDVAAIADQLRPQLVRYGALVDQADAAGLDGEALDEHLRRAVRAELGRHLSDRGLSVDLETDPLLRVDADLNAQGLAFAVRKRRFKRG
jgi:glyoxylase-like metal-dependent hydrolase (beta-lactamase superfamily II)